MHYAIEEMIKTSGADYESYDNEITQNKDKLYDELLMEVINECVRRYHENDGNKLDNDDNISLHLETDHNIQHIKVINQMENGGIINVDEFESFDNDLNIIQHDEYDDIVHIKEEMNDLPPVYVFNFILFLFLSSICT